MNFDVKLEIFFKDTQRIIVYTEKGESNSGSIIALGNRLRRILEENQSILDESTKSYLSIVCSGHPICRLKFIFSNHLVGLKAALQNLPETIRVYVLEEIMILTTQRNKIQDKLNTLSSFSKAMDITAHRTATQAHPSLE